tara:strand:- start:63 stop:422 length:360 start_codon:yes stop_codon:yes gene_type:complete
MYIKLLMVQRNSIKISSRIDKLIDNGGVKLHKFLPSNREIWTVVGSLGDQVIFINNNYCTCKALYFSIMRNKFQLCYHLQAVLTARKTNKYITTEISDYDYYYFISLLTRSICKQFTTK